MIQKVVTLAFKVLDRFFVISLDFIDQLICRMIFFCQSIQLNDFTTHGLPYVSVARSGKCIIGAGFKMNNGLKSNPIGPAQRSILFVAPGADLCIGKNVGISQTAIVCFHKITIGDNVRIGAGACIYDTDFHSLFPADRLNGKKDEIHTVMKPVELKDNVFVGAHSTILKGTTIGENSIIGACSVVTKSIPDNEIWAGNPAKFIRKLYTESETAELRPSVWLIPKVKNSTPKRIKSFTS
jgi:acetyltransferase-like isoleucine patch superfamily enzyme